MRYSYEVLVSGQIRKPSIVSTVQSIEKNVRLDRTDLTRCFENVIKDVPGSQGKYHFPNRRNNNCKARRSEIKPKSADERHSVSPRCTLFSFSTLPAPLSTSLPLSGSFSPWNGLIDFLIELLRLAITCRPSIPRSRVLHARISSEGVFSSWRTQQSATIDKLRAPIFFFIDRTIFARSVTSVDKQSNGRARTNRIFKVLRFYTDVVIFTKNYRH